MTVHVEFHGVPREQAGMAETEIEAETLGEAIRELRRRLPTLEPVCLAVGRLSAGHLANLNARIFVSDPDTALIAGDRLLVVSAAGGG